MRAILKLSLLLLLSATLFVARLLVTPLVYQILAKAKTSPPARDLPSSPVTPPCQRTPLLRGLLSQPNPQLRNCSCPPLRRRRAPTALPEPTPTPAHQPIIPDGW